MMRNVPALFKRNGWLLDNDMDQVMDRFFGSPLSTLDKSDTQFVPAVDVKETDKAFKIHADLPGHTREEISVNFDHGILTLSGERTREEDKKEERLHTYERSFGRFLRSFRIPGQIDADNIEAKFENGVLNVTLPKSNQSSSKSIDIQ